MADNGAAILIEEKDLTGQRLIEAVKGVIENPEKLHQMGKAASAMAVFDANERIYDVLMRLYLS